jgi:hypothetical protein
MLVCACYQDGLLDAFDYITANKRKGDYSHRCYTEGIVNETYARLLKEREDDSRWLSVAYVMRRQALEEELQRQGPPAEPAIDRARALLDEFPRFWEIETEPAERRKLLLSLFEQIWAQNGQIVAVQPHDDFLPYFQAIQHGAAPGGAEGGSDGTRTRDLCRDRAAL